MHVWGRELKLLLNLALLFSYSITVSAANAHPIGYKVDCLQKSLAGYVHFSVRLTEKPLEAPFSDDRLLKLLYGRMLSECHAEQMLEESGISRSVPEEIAFQRQNQSSRNSLQYAIDTIAGWGNDEVVFFTSSRCVSDAIRKRCLDRFVPE